MLLPFRSARDLFPSRRKNSELSAGKANVTAILVMLSKALQRNVKHEARLSNISDYFTSQVEII
jgi:hypothetical protein